MKDPSEPCGSVFPESEILHESELYRGREELERILKEARTSEAWLRKIIDTIPAQAYCNLPDGTNEYSNKRWQDYTGLSSEESSGWGWQTAYHPEDLPRTMDKWRELLAAGEAGEIQARLRRHDGLYRWFLFRCEPLRDETGKIVRWYGTNTDIDDLKRTEEKLREQERELRQITDAIAQTLGVLDPSGAVLYANQTTLDYTGLTAEDLHASNFRERIFHPDDLKRLQQERKVALERGVPFEFEQRALRKDGQFRWFLIRYNPLLDEEGRVLRWYVAGTDIDDLKRTQEKLREDERELRRTTDAIPHEIVVQDASGVSLWANQATLDYTGLTADDVIMPGFRERIFHPDDIEGLREERQAALARGVSFEIEQRALRKDGQYRWFLIRYNPFRDEHGNLIRWYATGTDIDDRKRAEDRTRNENVALREEIVRSSLFEEIVGSSKALREVLAQVSKVAPTDSTVLIQGETGTGKELIARAIHNQSRRANRAFIRVNCAAIPSSLIASELFGHEKGAFTGALQRRLGRFESADEGTIFLDEIGELPPETQVALLRVLQEREIERIGGNQTIPVDIRVLTATNKDLSAAVADGTFRQDLFYRLNVFPIQLPALRDRAGDIPLLVEYLVERYGQKAGKRIRSISKATLDLFQNYPWPGNIRELQNVVERAVVLCDGDVFCVDPSWLVLPASPRAATPTIPLAEDLAERERAMIEKALSESDGMISGPTGAAAKLGIPRQTLESKIRKLAINRYRFKT
jgi:formate hydrogenlyase transcriptional activator